MPLSLASPTFKQHGVKFSDSMKPELLMFSKNFIQVALSFYNWNTPIAMNKQCLETSKNCFQRRF